LFDVFISTDEWYLQHYSNVARPTMRKSINNDVIYLQDNESNLILKSKH